MSNWEYAQDVPTSPWRSAMSIPREVTLRKTADGVRLVQNPVKEMKKLREKRGQFKGGTVAKANQWLQREHIAGNRLELEVEVKPAASGVTGLKLFKGENEETVIGIEPSSSRIFVDRTRSGQTDFHAKFPGVHEAPLASANKPVRLHVFLDACSVEVFANDGELVFTDLIFPSNESGGIEFFGSEDGGVGLLQVWPLKSAWQDSVSERTRARSGNGTVN
jgi:fructan beta-fructosidase